MDTDHYVIVHFIYTRRRRSMLVNPFEVLKGSKVAAAGCGKL